jgi:hypothetical protein
MTSVQNKPLASIPGAVCLLSAILLLAAPAPASAQSAADDRLRLALLGLQQEFAATLHEITPALLKLQKELVDQLRGHFVGVEEEERVGRRTMQDLELASEAYFRELELLQVMEARSGNRSISDKELLKIRIETRSQALSYLQRHSKFAVDRHRVGEITRTDVAMAKARALKAEVMLEALKSAAGE